MGGRRANPVVSFRLEKPNVLSIKTVWRGEMKKVNLIYFWLYFTCSMYLVYQYLVYKYRYFLREMGIRDEFLFLRNVRFLWLTQTAFPDPRECRRLGYN